MSNCKRCWKESFGRKYCYDCSWLRSNACSVISQNVKKLIKLFKQKWFTAEWFRKFNLYIWNIQKQQDILIDYIMIDYDISTLKKREL